MTVAGVRCCAILLALTSVSPIALQTGDAPVIVVETAHGAFAFETYPEEAPRTVAHIVGLVRRGFYDGQRVHRAVPDYVVQWGDPRSRDPSTDAVWGRGAAAASGTPVGAAEINKKRTAVKGAVAISHPGNATLADSQIFVTLADRPELNGKYAVFGRVISGFDVLEKMQRGDVIRKMSVRE
jgi:cyclophilin family peptidyl-prolyl cis-trans isomerase